MKRPILVSACMAFAIAAIAQQVELKLNANANFSFLPDFNNRLYIVDGFVTPGVISIANARNSPVIAETQSKTRAGAGFQLEAEIGRKFNDRWTLSLALGCMQLNYHYVSYIAQSFFANDTWLSHGTTRFTYILARPANVSYTHKRFSLQGGPALAYLFEKRYNDAVVIYDFNTLKARGAFFEEKGDAQKMLFGMHLDTRYDLSRRFDIMLGGQYFFNSIYKKEQTYKPLYDKSKVLQVHVGLCYTVRSAS